MSGNCVQNVEVSAAVRNRYSFVMSYDPEKVRWLNDQEQRDWRAILEANALLNEALNRQLTEDSGLSVNEYEVLVRLSEAKGESLRMSDLASQLVHSRSRLTHTINRMERVGLVRRESCAEDRRGVICSLTDEGHRAVVAAAPGHVEAVRQNLIDLLTPKQFHELGYAMAKVRTGIRDKNADN